MLQIVSLVVPIFAVILLGRLAVSRHILTPEGLEALNGFAYWLALPALLFGSIAESHSLEVIGIAGIYLACCIFVFAATMIVGWLLLDGSLARSAVFGLNATYGNVIFLGTPLVAAVFGRRVSLRSWPSLRSIRASCCRLPLYSSKLAQDDRAVCARSSVGRLSICSATRL